jgi:hypothetical protein
MRMMNRSARNAKQRRAPSNDKMLDGFGQDLIKTLANLGEENWHKKLQDNVSNTKTNRATLLKKRTASAEKQR